MVLLSVTHHVMAACHEHSRPLVEPTHIGHRPEALNRPAVAVCIQRAPFAKRRRNTDATPWQAFRGINHDAGKSSKCGRTSVRSPAQRSSLPCDNTVQKSSVPLRLGMQMSLCSCKRASTEKVSPIDAKRIPRPGVAGGFSKCGPCPDLDLVERLLQVGDDIAHRLQADRKSQEVRRHAGRHLLLVCQLGMRRCGRMDDQ